MAVNVSALVAQLRQNPLDSSLLDALRAHSEETREFAALAEALSLHAQAAADAGVAPVELAWLHLELGNLYRNQLHDRERALRHLQTAIELDGAQRAAIVGARELLTETGAWVQVAELWAREAESLPDGPKRAAALLELASVYEHRLGRRTRAAWALRDAVAAGADDLHVQHHLATLLLDEADRCGDANEATRMRVAAADALVGMAGAVADDYALAYLESALDAAPDHEAALALLDEVAPRMGRAEVFAPRWLAAIRATRNPTLARTLRLKMALAYLSVGQHRDARICLEPLLAAGDQEAIEIGAQLRDTGARRALPAQDPSERRDDIEVGSARRQRAAQVDERVHALARAGGDATGRGGAIDDASATWHDDFAALDARDAVDDARTEVAPDDVLDDDDAIDGDLLDDAASEAPFRNTMVEAAAAKSTPLTIADLNALSGGGLQLPVDEDADETSTAADDAEAVALRELRSELAKRLRFRDRRGAAEIAESLLERGVYDAGAIEALEEHFRLSRDFRRLRDLSLRLGRASAFPAEIRGTRLREAVMLSESKLGDPEGAAEALEALLTVEPADNDAFHKLRGLRTHAQQWDQLADLLERRAAAESERGARAAILRELGALERDMRHAPVQAIAAFAAARAFDPGQDDDDVALSALYLETARYHEAAATFEARLARAKPFQTPPLLAELARIYRDQLGDLARAQRALEQWRAVEPHKLEVLEALISVLDQRGDHRALIDALTDKVAMAPAAERAKLHERIAELALGPLDDPERAADAYADAITTAPSDRHLWSAAALAFERAGRTGVLDRLLWELAADNRDRPLAAELLEHLALTRQARGNLAGALEARELQYGATQARDVLEALVVLLRDAGRPAELARRLDELARQSEPTAARPLRLERATVLAHQLDDAEAAKTELERLLTELAPDDTSALKLLLELSAATGDVARRASAQERLLKLAPSLGARIALAVELVDIYETELSDAAGATRVLLAWSNLEPHNPQPLLRLLPHLTRAGQKRELLSSYDKLAALAIADDEAGEFVLRAARVAIELDDHDGAWNRLLPRVAEHDDAAAEAQLRELARLSGRGEQLAGLYVGLAQRAAQPVRERARWVDAAQAFEQLVGAYDRALEAMLRALARDLDSRELLAEVERLVECAHAWPRLIQVYDALVRRAGERDEKKRLLLRHAHLLETRAGAASAAFERAWLAFQLDPADDHVYAETIRLAGVAGRHDALLLGHERRAQANVSVGARIDALLEACALTFVDERARAVGYVARAVAGAGDAGEALERIESNLRVLDAKHPPVDGRGMLLELAEVYERLAAERGRDPALAATWLQRAARLYEVSLADPDAAYRALERATSRVCDDERLLDELQRAASLTGAWEPLATHLQRIASAAIDSRGSSMSLRRLGALCERQLNSPSRAADAYEQLVRLSPSDAEATARLRACLRDAHRFEELLIAIDRELTLAPADAQRRDLLKQAAEAWEFGLKNRYEALDAWKRVLTSAPEDDDAVAALARLRARPRTDDSLLDGDIVVRPEDLRPSIAGDDGSLAGAPSRRTADNDFDADAGVGDVPDAGDDEQMVTRARTEARGTADAHDEARGFAPERGGDEAPSAGSLEDEALDQALAVFDARVPVPSPASAVAVSLEGLSSLITHDELGRGKRIATPPPPPPPSSRRR